MKKIQRLLSSFRWEQIFKFLPQKFLTPSKIKNKLIWNALKKFSVQIQTFPMFLANLVVCIMHGEPHPDFLKTLGGDRLSANFFN